MAPAPETPCAQLPLELTTPPTTIPLLFIRMTIPFARVAFCTPFFKRMKILQIGREGVREAGKEGVREAGKEEAIITRCNRGKEFVTAQIELLCVG